jgi:hypothetical protein
VWRVWACGLCRQLQRDPIVTTPHQHETEAEDDRRAFEGRAKSPWRDADLDGSDQRHEQYRESV